MRKFVFPLLVLVGSCQGPKAPSLPTVQVGVFFGGQIQRLKKVEIPAVRPPKLGFRVDIPSTVEPPVAPIAYEIVRPGPAGRRVTEKGTLVVPRGQSRIDHVIELDASSKLGLWNIRVVQEQAVLADRAVYLVEGPPVPL